MQHLQTLYLLACFFHGHAKYSLQYLYKAEVLGKIWTIMSKVEHSLNMFLKLVS